jgi:GAF domain-containing protein
VLATGEPLLINDAPNDPRARESSAVKLGNQKSIMAVPLACENEVFGVLYLGETSTGRFSDHDLMLATILANHAAASLRQARLHRELAKKMEELECAHQELVGADRLKAEFISTVTAEMRVPLDAIRTYSQTLLQKADDDAFPLRRKFLAAVVEESTKLLSTVNGVIDLSRMEFGEGDLRLEETRIEEVVKQVCDVLEPVCMEKGVEIAVEVPAAVAPARLDRDMIYLLFRNLIEAAASFARAGAQIRLVLTEDEEFIKVTVSLTPSAAGIKMEHAIRAVWGNQFIPPDAGAVGLTLQVCRNIVLRHGGRIWAETHDPASWSFVILFGRARRTIVPSDLTFEILTSRPELRSMLAMVADMISKVVEVRRCLIFLEDPATGNLMLEAAVGGDQTAEHGLVVEGARGATGRVFRQGEPIILNSRSLSADSPGGERLPFERPPCAAVPIRSEGRAVGVVTVSEKTAEDAWFDEGDMGLLAALADRIAIALERTTSYESARDQFVAVMTAMRAILEARRLPSAKSSVADLAVELGRGMGLEEGEVRLLRYVSRIYDVGMVKVGEGILRKRGGLGVSEYESVKRHPEAGVDIVGPIEFLEQVKQVIMHHHERYDGGGYPEGLKGEAIPIGARILAVVDSYSSMLSERPYRRAMTREEALEELSRCSGSQFDPTVVEKFAEMEERREAVEGIEGAEKQQ